MGKQKHFKFTGFLKISGEAEIHAILKIWGKWISIVRGKYGKTQDFPYSLLPYILRVMRTHAIPNVWKCANSHKMEIFCGKPYHSQAVGF